MSEFNKLRWLRVAAETTVSALSTCSLDSRCMLVSLRLPIPMHIHRSRSLCHSVHRSLLSVLRLPQFQSRACCQLVVELVVRLSAHEVIRSDRSELSSEPVIYLTCQLCCARSSCFAVETQGLGPGTVGQFCWARSLACWPVGPWGLSGPFMSRRRTRTDAQRL